MKVPMDERSEQDVDVSNSSEEIRKLIAQDILSSLEASEAEDTSNPDEPADIPDNHPETAWEAKPQAQSINDQSLKSLSSTSLDILMKDASISPINNHGSQPPPLPVTPPDSNTDRVCLSTEEYIALMESLDITEQRLDKITNDLTGRQQVANKAHVNQEGVFLTNEEYYHVMTLLDVTDKKLSMSSKSTLRDLVIPPSTQPSNLSGAQPIPYNTDNPIGAKVLSTPKGSTSKVSTSKVSTSIISQPTLSSRQPSRSVQFAHNEKDASSSVPVQLTLSEHLPRKKSVSFSLPEEGPSSTSTSGTTRATDYQGHQQNNQSSKKGRRRVHSELTVTSNMSVRGRYCLCCMRGKVASDEEGREYGDQVVRYK